VSVEVIWSTPDADNLLGYMARVSNPDAKPEDEASKLISYLIRNDHWSPFEMVNMCVEINTTRTIARQILRHRSFSFQEFSQRYAAVTQFTPNIAPRLQDPKNRQASIPTDDYALKSWWMDVQDDIKVIADSYYNMALDRGIAKEVARDILPEGYTPTKMYMNGNFRSWLHYFKVRTGNGTQPEHVEIAQQIEELFAGVAPDTYKAIKEHYK
jgi:thymidylate synthase (FAD)